ncbi:phage tail tape measure protein [Pseudoxanthomonas mexicana]
MATAGSIVIDLLLRTGSFETDSKRAEKRLKEFQKEAVAAGKALGAGAAVAGAALAAVTWDAIQFADQLDEVSNRLGISTETLSGWGYAAKMSGTDLESLTSALPKLSKTLASAADEGSRAAQLFDALGIDAKDAAGNLRDVEDVLPEIADRFKALKNDTTEAALAQELFGRSGAEMLEFLNRGSAGIEELTDRAARLGIVVSGETAASAAALNDRLDDLKAISTAFGLEIAELVVPQLTRLTDWLIESHEEGKLLGFEIEDLGGAVDYFADELSKADSIGESFKATIDGMKQAASSLGDALSAVVDLDFQRFKSSFGDYWDAASGALDAAVNGVPAQPKARRVNFSDERAIPRSMLGDANFRDPTPDINRWLAGAGAASKKAGQELSEAEKAAKRLQDQFDQTLAGLEEQQYMLGKTGEEARVRYEVELGALKDLDQAKKDQLITEAAYLDAMTKAREDAEKLAEATKRADEAFNDVNKELLAGVKLLGMSADEQEIWNNLAWAGVTAEDERGKQIIENTKRLQGVRDAMNDQIDAMDAIRDAGKDLIVDFANGVKPLDAIEDAWDRIHQKILGMIAENLMDQLFGKQGDPAGGSTGGWFQGILDGFFGNGGQSAQSSAMASGGAQGGGFWSNVASWAGSLFGGSRAGGGDVLEGRGYWVGEQGPEWFQPRTAGTVLPHEKSMQRARGSERRSAPTVINVAVEGRVERHTRVQIGTEVDRSLQRSRRIS